MIVYVRDASPSNMFLCSGHISSVVVWKVPRFGQTFFLEHIKRISKAQTFSIQSIPGLHIFYSFAGLFIGIKDQKTSKQYLQIFDWKLCNAKQVRQRGLADWLCMLDCYHTSVQWTSQPPSNTLFLAFLASSSHHQIIIWICFGFTICQNQQQFQQIARRQCCPQFHPLLSSKRLLLG